MNLYFMGQPGQPRTGGTAPRIAGISHMNTKVDLVVYAGSVPVSTPGKTRLKLAIINRGETSIKLDGLEYMHPKGVTVNPVDISPVVIGVGERESIDIKVEIADEYSEPILSFTTILVSCIPLIEGLPRIPVTAGFERLLN